MERTTLSRRNPVCNPVETGGSFMESLSGLVRLNTDFRDEVVARYDTPKLIAETVASNTKVQPSLS